MHPYANLKPGAGFQLDRALGYYGQRLVTAPPLRRLISSGIAAMVRAKHGRGEAGPLSGPEREIYANLKRDGVAMLPPTPQTLIDEMVAYFKDNQVVGPDGRLSTLEDVPAGVGMANYPLETVLDCPGLISVINSPSVLRLAAKHLGCMPTISSVGVRWSLPRGRQSVDTQRFHRDVDDWRFLKIFVYLTDVDDVSGPHTYVKTSQSTGFGLKAKAYAPDDLQQRYGQDRFWTITGERGTTFVADTQGIHRGDVPTEKPRLILQAQYSLLPIYAFLYQPVERSAPEADAYVNRLMLRATQSAA